MTIPEVPPLPDVPDDPDVPDQPSASDKAGDELIDAATRNEDEHDAHRAAGADRSPTVEEEIAAEEAEHQIESELGSIAEHQRQMTRLGAEAEGEGRI